MLLKPGGYLVSGGSHTSSKFTLESSLQTFFYDQLQEFNKKSLEPLPNETIYYSSLVMDRYGEAKEYFETSEGKVRDKVLGIKLLEASRMAKEERKRVLKDIGDTALIICGFFSDSLNKKIIDTRYYQDLGQSAYSQLNSVVPSFYDIPSFYSLIAGQFQSLTTVMGLVSERTFGHSARLEEAYLITSKKLVG